MLAELSELDEHSVEHLHPNEPDARVMLADKRLSLAYNVQLVVDHETDLIVCAGMTNEPNDSAQLVPMLEATRQLLGTTAKQTVADTGYAAGRQIDEAERRHLPVLSEPQGESDKGPLPKSSFTYDAERDAYICPTGEVLPPDFKRKMRCAPDQEESAYRCHNGRCPERAACTKDYRGRTVSRTPFDDALERQRALLTQPSNRNLYGLRKEIIEHHFGNIKHNQRFRRFTVRGMAKAFAQLLLVCIAINLRKLCAAWLAGSLSNPREGAHT